MSDSEQREFMRQLTLRHEQASREMQRGLWELARRSDAQIEGLRELIEESRAQRQALLAVLDRLDGPATA